MAGCGCFALQRFTYFFAGFVFPRYDSTLRSTNTIFILFPHSPNRYTNFCYNFTFTQVPHYDGTLFSHTMDVISSLFETVHSLYFFKGNFYHVGTESPQIFSRVFCVGSRDWQQLVGQVVDSVTRKRDEMLRRMDHENCSSRRDFFNLFCKDLCKEVAERGRFLLVCCVGYNYCLLE